MDPKKLQRVVVDALDDIKAQDVRVFDTTAQTELFDRVVIATGTSNRQTRALASHVRDKVKEAGAPVISMEGADSGEWVLVDLGDIVVHVMQPAIRQYYNLEELWGARPVRLSVGKRPAVAKKPAAKKIAAKNPDTENTTAKKSTAKKAVAKKAVAKKAVAKKALAKKALAKKALAKKTASTKAPTKTAARTATKTPAKRAATKRTAAKRTATKRTSNG